MHHAVVLLETKSFTAAVYNFLHYNNWHTFCWIFWLTLHSQLVGNKINCAWHLVWNVMFHQQAYIEVFTGTYSVTVCVTYNCQAVPICFLTLTCLLQTRQYKDVPLYLRYSVLTTAFCLHYIYLVWDINVCWQSVFLKHILVSGYKCNNKRILMYCFSLQFVSNIDLFNGKYALQIPILEENSALPQALISITFVIAVVGIALL